MNTPYLKRFRNGEYLQYMTDVLELLSKKNLKNLQLEAQNNKLQSATQQIDAAFKKVQGSELTQEIIEIDNRRDNALKGLKSIFDSFKYHFQEAVVKSATLLANNMNGYGTKIHRLSYQEETAVINSVLQDWEKEPKLTQAINQLQIMDWVTELKQSNELFAKTYVQRVGETASIETADIPELRNEATDAYRELVKHIQAHQILNPKKGYTDLVNEIDVLAKKYNLIVDNRSKK